VNDLVAPAPALRPFVEAYWQRRGAYEDERKVRVLADACTKVIFELVPMPWPSAYVIATQLLPIVVTLSGRTDRVGIRFRLGMAGFFLGCPLGGLKRPLMRLSDIRIECGELVKQLRPAELAQRAALIDEWLLARWEAVNPDRSEVEGTARLGQGLVAGLPPRELAALMDWSDRRLQRICRERFGASAASLHRFYRFECLQKRLSGSPTELAALAVEIGFADQAHMSREFRHFAGSTISAFLRERATVGNLQDGGGWLPVLRKAGENAEWPEI
jgi:AraC-like DNA-binding protein